MITREDLYIGMTIKFTDGGGSPWTIYKIEHDRVCFRSSENGPASWENIEHTIKTLNNGTYKIISQKPHYEIF